MFNINSMNSNPNEWVDILKNPSCSQTLLTEVDINHVRDMTLPVFECLGNIDEAQYTTVLGHFARLQDSAVTLQLISLGMVAEFPLKILRDVLEPIPKMTGDSLFDLFFIEKNLADCDDQMQAKKAIQNAFQSLMELLILFPEVNKTTELTALFITPATQFYQDYCLTLPEEDARPLSVKSSTSTASWCRPPSTAYDGDDLTLDNDQRFSSGSARPISMRSDISTSSLESNNRPFSIKSISRPINPALNRPQKHNTSHQKTPTTSSNKNGLWESILGKSSKPEYKKKGWSFF